MIRRHPKCFLSLCSYWIVLHTIFCSLVPQRSIARTVWLLNCITNDQDRKHTFDSSQTHAQRFLELCITTQTGILLSTVLTHRSAVIWRGSFRLFLPRERVSSEAVRGVIPGGDIGLDHVVSTHWIVDVLSSVCIGKWLGSKKNTIISGWLFGSGAVNRQNDSVTELTNTFAAYIRWFIRQPQACFTYLKNPTQIALFWLWNVSLVSFFHAVKNLLPW